MKDNFSEQAKLYAQFRPSYPTALYEYLLPLIPEKNRAWDAGTGNGQVAGVLADYFEDVTATDISEKQLAEAIKKDNIVYKVENAETANFAPKSLDLITVAQAVHWFNFEAFYQVVKAALKPHGIMAIMGYALIEVENETINNLIKKFYEEIVGPYWDPERRYIDAHYENIPFPFQELDAPSFSSQYEWTLPQMIGFLNTWSATQHYIRKNNSNPVDLILAELTAAWSSELMTVNFPILFRLGVLGHKPNDEK